MHEHFAINADGTSPFASYLLHADSKRRGYREAEMDFFETTSAHDLLSTGSAVLFIGPEGAAPEGAVSIAISEVDPILDVAAALVPLHLLAWRLAHNAGRRPDRMVMASKVTTRE